MHLRADAVFTIGTVSTLLSGCLHAGAYPAVSAIGGNLPLVGLRVDPDLRRSTAGACGSDILKLELRVIRKGYRHRAVIQRDVLNPNTLFALAALFTLQGGKPLLFRDCICDEIFLDGDLIGGFTACTLRTGITLIAFIALIAFQALFALRPGSLHAGIGRTDPPVAVSTDKGGVAILAIDAILAVGTVFTVQTVQTVQTVSTVLTCGTGSTLQAFQPLGLCSGGCKTRFLRNFVGGFSVAAILSVRSLQGCQPLRLAERTAVFFCDFIGGLSRGTIRAVSAAGNNAGVSCTDPPVAVVADIRGLSVGTGSALQALKPLCLCGGCRRAGNYRDLVGGKAVLAVKAGCAHNFAHVCSFAVGEGYNKLALFVDSYAHDTNAILTVLAILTVGAVLTVLTVFAILAVLAVAAVGAVPAIRTVSAFRCKAAADVQRGTIRQR